MLKGTCLIDKNGCVKRICCTDPFIWYLQLLGSLDRAQSMLLKEIASVLYINSLSVPTLPRRKRYLPKNENLRISCDQIGI